MSPLASLLFLLLTLLGIACFVALGLIYGVLWGMRIEQRRTRWREDSWMKLRQERWTRERVRFEDHDRLVSDLRQASESIDLATKVGIEERLFFEEEGQEDFELAKRLAEHANRIDPKVREHPKTSVEGMWS